MEVNRQEKDWGQLDEAYFDQLYFMLACVSVLGRRLCGSLLRSTMLDTWLMPLEVMPRRFKGAFQRVLGDTNRAWGLTPDVAQVRQTRIPRCTSHDAAAWG